MKKYLTLALLAILIALPPIGVAKYINYRNNVTPTVITKVMALPKPRPVVKKATIVLSSYCKEVNSRIAKYGKDAVLSGAYARSMTKPQVDKVLKDCNVK